jgi:hypothetical protein
MHSSELGLVRIPQLLGLGEGVIGLIVTTELQEYKAAFDSFPSRVVDEDEDYPVGLTSDHVGRKKPPDASEYVVYEDVSETRGSPDEVVDEDVSESRGSCGKTLSQKSVTPYSFSHLVNLSF